VIFVRAARAGRLAGRGPTAAVDATAFEPRHASAAYARARRRGVPRRAQYPPHPKLTLAVHTASHLIAGVVTGVGPSPDAPGFAPVMRQAAGLLRLGAAVADAGFDSEGAHALCHQTLGIRRTAIRLNPRRTRKWPRTPYRRAMRRRFPSRVYRRRVQVESVISRLKRHLGSALTARRPEAQRAEQVLRALTYNLMILHSPRDILSTEPL
jgi:Transposase DDE domain